MPSPAYDSLLAFVSGYVQKEKAHDIMERQMKSRNVTPDSFTAKDLGALKNVIGIALSLYVPDAARKAEFKSKLQAMA